MKHTLVIVIVIVIGNFPKMISKPNKIDITLVIKNRYIIDFEYFFKSINLLSILFL